MWVLVRAVFLSIPLFADTPKLLNARGHWFLNHKMATTFSSAAKMPIHLSTDESSVLRFSFRQIEFELQEKSDLSLDEDSQGKLPLVHLERGRVLVLNPNSDQWILNTPLTSEKTSVAAALFDYSKPELKVSVAKGQFTLRGIGSEEGTQVLAGEKAFLRAKLENEELVFDTLLDGKKVVRAALSQSSKMTSEENKDAELKPQLKTQKKAQNIVSAQNICRTPNGQLNECVWTCERGRRVRRRCTAGGSWADKMDVGSSCDLLGKALVAACDY